MTESRFEALRSTVLSLLENNLDPKLTYHNLGHTMDVIRQVERIAIGEKISDKNDILLLKVAALFHDSGFLEVYKHHEDMSCNILMRHINGSDLTEAELEKVKGMIMATKIPQTPYNKLEEIICDADLDYLGREDFEPISLGLKDEFLEFGVIKSEADWDPLQIRFFEAHSYFTKTCQQDRAPRKAIHLEELKAKQPLH
ncbi:MAG TPA: HD domain-containing protein [Chitinophagaceae bacterium]|nr:HD domain-containing protein [Chitinophagaceae bacterium]